MHISYHKNALYNELLFHENCLDSAIERDDLSETEIIHTERDNPPIKNSIKVLSSNWSKSHSTRADSDFFSQNRRYLYTHGIGQYNTSVCDISMAFSILTQLSRGWISSKAQKVLFTRISISNKCFIQKVLLREVVAPRTIINTGKLWRS